MAVSTLKSPVERGELTLTAPFQLLGWGHASYTKYGPIAVISLYAYSCTQDVSTDTVICTLPFKVRGYHGTVSTAINGNKTLTYAVTGQQTLSTNIATSNTEYYTQIVVDTY